MHLGPAAEDPSEERKYHSAHLSAVGRCVVKLLIQLELQRYRLQHSRCLRHPSVVFLKTINMYKFFFDRDCHHYEK